METKFTKAGLVIGLCLAIYAIASFATLNDSTFYCQHRPQRCQNVELKMDAFFAHQVEQPWPLNNVTFLLTLLLTPVALGAIVDYTVKSKSSSASS